MTRKGCRRACLLLAGTTLIAVATTPARAQTAFSADEGTIYFGQEKATHEPNFWLSSPTAALSLNATYTNSHTSGNGTDTTTHQAYYVEQLSLYTHGYIVHPNIVDLSINVTGGLSQSHYSDNFGNTDTSGTVYGWDITATILRNQGAPLTLYTRRTESTFNVPFGPTEKLTEMQSGALWTYSTSSTVMRFEGFDEQETQSNFSTNGDTFTMQRDVLRGDGTTQLSSSQTFSWSFNLEDDRFDSAGTTTDEQLESFSLNHTASLGRSHQAALASSFSYSTSEGTFHQDDTRWTEHLHVTHSQDFETNYQYSYEQLNLDSNITDHQTAYMDARHQLYKSLTTVGMVQYDDVESDGSGVKTYTANLSLNYNKQVPYGVFLADAHVGYWQEDINGAGPFSVANQPATFTGLNPVVINQANVIASSILIRDAFTGRIFTQGVDYTVTQTPVDTQINRIIGGNIAPGEPLLMDYTYSPLDASQISTETFGLGGRYQFTRGPLAGLAPYARFNGQNQSVVGDTPPNNVRDYIAGVEYQLSELTLRAEREWYESSVYPYDAWRYLASWAHDISLDTTVDANAAYTDISYHDPADETRNFSLTGSVTRRFTLHLSGSVYAAYALVDDQIGGQTRGLEEGVQVNWTQSQMQVYVRLRNSNLDTDQTKQSFQTLMMGLSRSF